MSFTLAQRKTEIASRRRQVAELYLERHSQERIAQMLGCAEGTVNSDLKAIRAAWREEMVSDTDAILTRELAELDDMERELCTQEFSTHWVKQRLKIKELRAKLLGLFAPDKSQVDITSGGVQVFIPENFRREPGV